MRVLPPPPSSPIVARPFLAQQRRNGLHRNVFCCPLIRLSSNGIYDLRTGIYDVRTDRRQLPHKLLNDPLLLLDTRIRGNGSA